MNPNLREPELDLRNLFKMLKPYWLWIGLFALLLALATFVLSSLQPPIYQASARVLAAQGSSVSQGNFNGTIPVATVLDAPAYREAALSNQVLGLVLESQKLSATPTDLDRFKRTLRLTTVDGFQSNVLVLSVLNRDPQVAAELANAWADRLRSWDVGRVRASFANYRASLEAQFASTGQGDPIRGVLARDINLMKALESSASGQLTLLDPAIVPARPAGPRSLLNALAAFVLGILLAMAAFLIKESNDRRVRSADDAYRATGLPVLGEFPEHPTNHQRSLSPEVADYLEVNLNLSDGPKAVAVTSPNSGEGKTSVALSLAKAAARSGKRVLLVDLNLRAPMLYQEFGIYKGTDIVAVMQRHDLPFKAHLVEPNLEFIPCLQLLENPSRFLAEFFRGFLRGQLESGSYDLIVFDTAPVLSVTDTLVIAPHLSGVLLVAEQGQTDKLKLRSAQAILKRVGAKVLGLVANRTTGSESFVLVAEKPGSAGAPSVMATIEQRPTIEFATIEFAPRPRKSAGD